MKKYVSAFLAMMVLPGACSAEEKPVQAAVRGNTAVVAVSCDWLEEYCSQIYKPGERMNTFTTHSEFVESSWLDENLSDAEQEALLLDHSDDGRAYMLKLDMDIFSSGEWEKYDRLEMSVRCIDGAWYMVFRQDELNFESACRYTARQIFWEDRIEIIRDVATDIPESLIGIQRFKGSATCEIQCDDLKISIFEAIGANIAVIEEKNADKNRISQVRLKIEGAEETKLSGYMDGSSAIYCCVLSEREVRLLREGAPAQLLRNDLTTDYAGTQWGIAQSGEYWGIVDGDGNFIVDAKYMDIERTEMEGVFILQAPNLSFVVYDANRQKSILTIPHDGGWGTDVKVKADGTIIAKLEGKIKFCDVQDGSLLREIDADSEPDEYMKWLDDYLGDSAWVSFN